MREEAHGRPAGARRYHAWSWRAEVALQRFPGKMRFLLRGRRSPLRDETFAFAGREHRYFVHWFNSTWMNERAVEIALALPGAAEVEADRRLELGNVLPYYGVRGHLVVDLFEQGDNIVNCDVLDFRPDRSFDRIVSVSTLEHVGTDDGTGSPERAVRAVDHLLSMLAPGGRALLTWPTGYNPALDQMAMSGGPLESRAMIRLDRDNRWREASIEAAFRQPYGSRFRFGNGLIVASAVGSVERSQCRQASRSLSVPGS